MTLDNKISLKGIVHPQIKILSSFTHLQVVPNLKSEKWISLFCWTQMKIFWRKFVTSLFWGTIDFHSRKINIMEVNGAPELCFPLSSEYLPLCLAKQRHSYRFGTIWGWVNDDNIFIFGWTIPLSRWGIFLAIAKKTLYGSKLLIFLLWLAYLWPNILYIRI